MATLHLPKNRPAYRKDRKTQRDIDRELDESLKQTFPASDPLSIVTPGSAQGDTRRDEPRRNR